RPRGRWDVSETKKGIPMPSLDAVLRDWPETTSSESHARAESVMSRLGERGSSAAYVSDDDLLSDPLGLAEDDRQHAPAADRERDRKNLQDLAKMAQGLTPAPVVAVATEQKVDSG